MSKLSNLSLKIERKLPSILDRLYTVGKVLLFSGLALALIIVVTAIIITGILSGSFVVFLLAFSGALVILGASIWLIASIVRGGF